MKVIKTSFEKLNSNAVISNIISKQFDVYVLIWPKTKERKKKETGFGV